MPMTKETKNAIKSDADHIPCIITNVISLEVFHCTAERELVAPLKARDYKDPLVVVYELSKDDEKSEDKQLGWHTDSTYADRKERTRATKNAGQREF